MEFFKSMVAVLMAIITFIASLFGLDIPQKKLDLSDFELVWADEFDGTELDRTKWTGNEQTDVRRGGYWNIALAEVADGNLTIYSKYLENGVNEGDPAGWYTTELTTAGLFEQTYGYFEIRCILPKGLGQWSAFWMMNDDAMRNPYPDGATGAEIDIFEAPYFGSKTPNRVDGAVHWGGYGDAHHSIGVYPKPYPEDPYNSYNTYGLEWNADEYIYYINGKEAARVDKSKAVPSQKPEYLIVSVEIGGTNGIPGHAWPVGIMEDNGRDFVSEFVIDYVRAYQYK